MSKKTGLILSVVVLLVVVIWGFLSGGIKVKFSITKSDETQKQQTVSVLEDKETVSETENSHENGYYATVEELIKDREGTAEGLLAVEGENTMVLFMGKKGEEGIDYGVEVFQKMDGGYIEPEKDEKRTKAIQDGIVICYQGEYYVGVDIYGTSKEVTDNIGGEFKIMETEGEACLAVKYISCPIENYELYINGVQVDLSDTYELNNEEAAQEYASAEEFIEVQAPWFKAYVLVPGENTYFFFGENDEESESGKIKVSYLMGEIVNGKYCVNMQDALMYDITQGCWAFSLDGEYYIQYVSETGEELNIRDNQDSEFQTMRTSNGCLVYQTYITCPIEEYEFYVNEEKLDLSLAYE